MRFKITDYRLQITNYKIPNSKNYKSSIFFNFFYSIDLRFNINTNE